MEQRERLRAFRWRKLHERFAFTLLSVRAFPRHAVASRPAVALREGWLAKADAFRRPVSGFRFHRSRSRHSSPVTRHSAAFTLLELLVVIAILSILLIAIIPAVSISKSNGRKGAINNLLGTIEQARAEAIKSGQITYVVFPTLTTAGAIDDRYGYKSYAVFQDDPANPAAPKQLTNWKTFPTGISIRSEISASPWASDVSFAFTPEGASKTEKFPYLKFNASGELQAPVPTATPLAVHVFEGYVDASGDRDTSKAKFNETIQIASLTGRAEHVP